jgi:hypothetical protein
MHAQFRSQTANGPDDTSKLDDRSAIIKGMLGTPIRGIQLWTLWQYGDDRFKTDEFMTHA